MRRLSLAAAAFAALLPTSAAQAADETATVIDYFTVANVTAVLNELKATNITSEKEEQVTTIRAEIGGYPISFGIQKCVAAGCIGMLIGAGMDPGARVSSETLLGFTGKMPPTPAIRLQGNAVALVRAEISLGGMRSSNLRENIALVVGTVPVFVKHLKDAVIASNEPPRTHDVRPAYLSAKDLRDLTFLVPDVSDLPTRKPN